MSQIAFRNNNSAYGAKLGEKGTSDLFAPSRQGGPLQRCARARGSAGSAQGAFHPPAPPPPLPEAPRSARPTIRGRS